MAPAGEKLMFGDGAAGELLVSSGAEIIHFNR